MGYLWDTKTDRLTVCFGVLDGPSMIYLLKMVVFQSYVNVHPKGPRKLKELLSWVTSARIRPVSWIKV